MNIEKINEEVFYVKDAIAKIGREQIDFLKIKAGQNNRKRARLCSHKSIDDLIHEMLIAHTKGNYVCPHKHPNKIESFHVIEGNLSVVIFDDSGSVLEVIKMSDYGSGEVFYYRLSDNLYHTVIPRSELVVFHEITNGPFNRQDTVFASWAPGDNEVPLQAAYLDKLSKIIK